MGSRPSHQNPIYTRLVALYCICFNSSFKLQNPEMSLYKFIGRLAIVSYVAAAQVDKPACICNNVLIPVSINTTTVIPSFPPFVDSSAATEWVLQMWNNASYVPVSGVQNISETFHISARYCTPKTRSARSNILQFMTPGFGFDKT